MARHPAPPAAPDPKGGAPTDRAAAWASRHSRRRGADPFAFYRKLAAFSALDSYRAKLCAAVAGAIGLPFFTLVLLVVFGTGRLSALALLVAVVLAGAAATGLAMIAIDRLLRPLQLARRALDSLAHQQELPRMELPGTDDAAMILRGAQGLVARVRAQESTLAGVGERDELTGLLHRQVARVRLQSLVDAETRRGREVRIVLADVIGMAAFNARFGTGHGDGLLKALAARIARVAGDDGIAARWSGDAFLFAQAVVEDEREDTVVEHLSRPLVVRGAPDPMRLAFAETRVSTAADVDAAIVMAETQMRAAHAS